MLNQRQIPVLLVDDKPENLIALEALLVDMPLDLELIKAGSGNDGLREALKRDFAVILLDVQMPHMTGMETAELLRANPKTRHLPIIFVTAGMTDKAHLFTGYELGAVDYLVKPIESIVLRSKVNVFCELYQQRMEIEYHKSNLEVQVKERTAELTALNEQLESRVQERTRELQHALQQMMESERLASLGSIVAGVAHELNTPLGNCVSLSSTLQGEAQLLANEVAAGKLRRSAFEQFLACQVQGHELLTRNLERASELVESFKHVAVDQTSNKRRKFDLKKAVEENIMTLEQMYKKTPFSMTLDLQPGIGLDSYPGPVGQIITNFTANALAHAFDGRTYGTMSLSTRLLNVETVEMIFCDDGVGIPAHNLKHVFDPFFTTKLGKGGSGLGLSIVHSLVTQVLGGTVSVDSSLEKGTTFTVILPIVAPNC